MAACLIERYAVIGHPVAHSKSPLIHALFARQTNEPVGYEKLDAPLTGFRLAADTFFANRGQGLNVTLPFKLEAFHYATRHSERARRAGAVNTLVLEEMGWFGDNTDGIGLIRDLGRLAGQHGVKLQGMRVLVLGAGGAARGILGPLLDAAPQDVMVANRDSGKALALAALFRSAQAPIRALQIDALHRERFDLILNATSAGPDDRVLRLPEALLRAAWLVYDLSYGDGPAEASTAFLRAAREEGASTTSDGMGMLVEQAAESFLLWRGVRPKTEPVLAALRDAAALKE